MANDFIHSDPEVMGGTPCIKGTRIPVYAIEARIKGGDSLASVLDDYPYVTAEQVAAALEYAARVPFVEHPDGRPWRKTQRQAAE